MPPQTQDVVIVGGGLAGLAAARRLHAAGLRTLVLEARPRLGGRVWSATLAKAAVDLGGQWVGPGQPHVLRWARELGLPLTPTHHTGDVVTTWGGVTRRHPGEHPPLSWLGQLDAAQLAWRLTRLAQSTPPLAPWARADAAWLDRQPFSRWLSERALTTAAREQLRFVVEAGACASAEQFSTLEAAHQLATIGSLRRLEQAESAFFTHGAQGLVDGLAAALDGSETSAVRCGCPVREIAHDQHSATVHGDGLTLRTRRVIVTVPVVLRAAIRFTPALAGRAQRVSRQFASGGVIKAVLVYARAWWRERGLCGLAATPGGPLTYLLDGSSTQGEPGVLVALATGDHAERWPTTSAQARIEQEVARLLGPPPGPLLGFTSVDWRQEPWIKGGYAARAGFGGWVDAGPALRQPTGVLFWAGTETATAWRSYMEGALQSGERAAAEALASLGGPGG